MTADEPVSIATPVAGPTRADTLEEARLAELRALQKADRERGARFCATCGCTDRVACLAGCYWVDATTCSQCVPEGTPGLWFRTATGASVRSFGVEARRDGERVRSLLAREREAQAAREAEKKATAKAAQETKGTTAKQPRASAAAAASARLKEQLMDLLLQEGGVMKREGLAERLGCGEGALQRALKELVKAGEVRRERALLSPRPVLIFLPARAAHRPEKARIVAGIRGTASTAPRSPSEA